MTAILTDPHLHQCLADIVQQANIGAIIETGTYHGDSTLEFAKMVQRVFSVELDDECYQIAKSRLTRPGITLERGSSASFLWTCLKIIADGEAARNDGNVLLFLDAHFFEDWPLLKELQAINYARQSGHRFVVIVDDFFIDNRPNFVGCYGGLRGADSEGRESELVPCGYNEPFATELDKFPIVIYPDYSDRTIGYGIFSDFPLNLGPNFKVVRDDTNGS